MRISPVLSRILPAALLIAIMLTLPACGRKGDLIIPGTILPGPVADLRAEPSSGAMLLSWTMPDKNSSGATLTNLAGFRIMRAELPEGVDECPCQYKEAVVIDLDTPGSALIQGRRAVWADMPPAVTFGKRYSYILYGITSDGYMSAESNTARALLLVPPKQPANLTAKAGNTTVKLDWSAVTEDAGGTKLTDFAGYDVQRSDDPAGPAQSISKSPVTTETFTDTNVKNNQTYYYTVSAQRGARPPYTTGPASAAVSAVPSDIEPPAAPMGLVAVVTEGGVQLSWDISPESDIAGYKIYRRLTSQTEFTPLIDQPMNRITYTDAGVVSGSEYVYVVTAVDRAVKPNESAFSNEAKVAVP